MDKKKPTSSKTVQGTASKGYLLTDDQKKLINSSWLVVHKDMERNSIELFISFFKSNPQYIAFFNDLKSVNPNDLNTDKNLRAHALTVCYGISSLLDRGFANSAVLKEQIRKIINSHLNRGVVPEYFQDFFRSLMQWLRRAVGEAVYTDEHEVAWTTFLDLFKTESQLLLEERNK